MKKKNTLGSHGIYREDINLSESLVLVIKGLAS